MAFFGHLFGDVHRLPRSRGQICDTGFIIPSWIEYSKHFAEDVPMQVTLVFLTCPSLCCFFLVIKVSLIHLSEPLSTLEYSSYKMNFSVTVALRMDVGRSSFESIFSVYI